MGSAFRRFFKGALSRQAVPYPDPYVDIANFNIPPSIKSLMILCRRLYLTHSIVHATIWKYSTYPITDIRVEAATANIRHDWEFLANNVLKLKYFDQMMSLDYFAYGNAMASLVFPFDKYLICPQCNFEQQAKGAQFVFNKTGQWDYRGVCPACKQMQLFLTEDRDVSRAYNRLSLIRWPPLSVDIDHVPYTSDTEYYHRIPRMVRDKLAAGSKLYSATLPKEFILAAKLGKRIRIEKDNFFHMKRPSISDSRLSYSPWGLPLILPIVKDAFWMQILRKSEEAMAFNRILPLRWIFPAEQNQAQFAGHHLGIARTRIESEVKKWIRDPNYIGISPTAIGSVTVGADGRPMLLNNEIRTAAELVTTGMGVPREFVFGGLCAAPETLVITDRGLLTLEELTTPSSPVGVVQSCPSVPTRTGVHPVNKGITVGEKTRTYVTTKLGNRLCAAPTHPILVLRPDLTQEWVKIEDLRAGDYVGSKIGMNVWPAEPLRFNGFVSVITHQRGVIPTIPVGMTEDLAKIMGYMVAEGHIEGERCGFANKDPDVQHDLADCVERVFGYRPTFSGPDGACKNCELPDRIAEFLRYAGVRGYSHDKRVPWSVRRSAVEHVCAFIRAYAEGDGGVKSSSTKQGVRMGSVSRSLLEDIQLMLMNMGIVSRISDASTRDMHYLIVMSEMVDRWAAHIGFTSPTKAGILGRRTPTKPTAQHHEIIPYLKQYMDGVVERVFPGRDRTGAKRRCRWVWKPISFTAIKATYSPKEIAKILQVDDTMVRIHIREGRLRARTVHGNGGRFDAYEVGGSDLEAFCQTYGRGERPKLRRMFWKAGRVGPESLTTLREMDPRSAQRIEEIQSSGLIWTKVTSIERTTNIVVMRDLGVEEDHSYWAQGLIVHNSYAGSNVSIRMVENDMLGLRVGINDLNDEFVRKRVQVYMDWPEGKYRLASLRMADDVQLKQFLANANAAGKLSDEDWMQELGFDATQQRRKRREEMESDQKNNEIQQLAMADIQGKMQVIGAKYAVEAELAGQELRTSYQKQLAAQQSPQRVPTAEPTDQEAMVPTEDQRPPSISERLNGWTQELSRMPPERRAQTLAQMQAKMPTTAQELQRRLGSAGALEQPDTRPLPEIRPPRRENPPI